MISQKQRWLKTGISTALVITVFSLVMAVSFVAQAKQGGKLLTLNLKGTGAAYTAAIPVIGGTGTTEATCFDVQLYNLSTGFQIGTATDCLADIEPIGEALKLVGTTFFNFTGGAQLVTRGNTTVQPMLHGKNNFTHTTGAEASGGNDILSGTRQYKNAKGSVRLSGLVNLDVDGEITFDCLFVIRLE